MRDAARRWGLYDHGISSRKVHGKPIPRMGGVAIVLGFFAPLAGLYFISSDVGNRLWSNAQATLALFVGGLAIAALGLYDDLKGCNAKTKFAVQFGVAAAMYWAGYRIDRISAPLGGYVDLGLLALPFTMLWIAGVINAMNLIDGLDGLAGGVAFIAVATTFALAVVNGDPLMLLLTGALAGAILGFLFYNFNPATIFMGDTGSMFLGFVLAVASIRSSQKSTATVAIAVPLLALAVPITDTLLAMGRRAARGAPLFSADRGHIHHRLLDQGHSHRTAVMIIYLGATVGGAAALMISFTKGATPALILAGVAVLAFACLRALGFMDLKKTQAALTDRRRNLELRAAVRKAGERLRAVRSAEELWRSVLHAAPAFGAVGVRLTLGRMEGREGWGPWEVGFEDLPEDALQARYGLIAERPGDDHIDLVWTDGRSSVHRDTEIAVELFCEQVSAALERLEGLEAPRLVAPSKG